MENLSHSRHPNRSKKACGNAAAAAKSLYDDVYGGPPKSAAAKTSLSPRMEDYSEIFGSFQASRASSIPVLDLPAVDEAEVFCDVRSSGFDYAEVFGGFEGLDFAVSYEDLFDDQSKAGRGNSSDEAWSPAEIESMSEESDTYGKDRFFSNGSPQQEFDRSTEFSISYHQARHIGSEEISNGMTHVAQLHAVSGFSFMVDSPSQRTEDKATDGGNLNTDFSTEIMEAKHLKKAMSHPANGSTGGRAFEDDPRPQKGYGKDGSSYRNAFVGLSDINLRTQPSDLPPPSRPPPPVECKKGDSSKLVSNRDALAFGGISGGESPPFFDVEVDASSSAAVSAAAMKEAMEKAQAKLKSAKELMEKKKEGLQNSYKSGSKKFKEKAGEPGKIIDGSNRLKDERVKGSSEREDGGTSLFAREEKKKVSKTALEVPEILDGEELFSPLEKHEKDKPLKESWSLGGSYKINEASEWKEATEFFELVTTDEPKEDFQQVNSKKILVQNIQIHEQKVNEVMGSFEKQSNGRKVKTAREDHEEEFDEKKKGEELCGHRENIVKSKEAKEASELKDCERKTKVTYEVCELGENKKISAAAKQLAETNKNFTEAGKSVKEEEPKSKNKKAMKQKDNEEKMMATDKVDEIEKKLKLFHETIVKEERQRLALDQDRSEKRFREVVEQVDNEKKVQKGVEREENENWLKEILEKVASDRRPKEVVTQQENEKLLKQPLEQGKSKKKENEVLDMEDEKRRDEAYKGEENEKTRKSASGDNDIRKEAREQEDSKERSNVGPDNEETEVKQFASQNMSKEVLEHTTQVLKDAIDSEATKRLNKAHEKMEKVENSKEVKVDKGTLVNMEENGLLQSSKAHNLDCSKNVKPILLACDIDESCGKAETPQEIHAHEEMKDTKAETLSNEPQTGAVGRNSESTDKNLKVSSSAENIHFKMDDAKEALPFDGSVKSTSEDIEVKPKASEKESAAFEMENVVVGGNTKAFVESQGNLECGKNPYKLEDVCELPQLDDQVKKTEQAGSANGDPYADKVKSCSAVGSDSENQEREFADKWTQRGEECTKAQGSLSQEEKKESTMPTQLVKESTDDKRKPEAAQPPRAEEKRKNQKSIQQVNESQITDRKDKISGEVENERAKRAREMEKERLRKVEEEREREEKQKNQKSAHQVNVSQTMERKEKTSGGVETERIKREREVEHERFRKMEEEREREEKQQNQKSVQQVNASQTTERREKTSGEAETERMRREREMENERLRKIEEEREREREREKDRMAVDLATLEARERAFGESREKAERAAVERATAEARQRAMAEARERLEKACAEAREKSLAGKTAMEARIRAERAAVERATAEARERAAERAMAERAAYEARERVQRSVSDKFSASSRNSGMRQSSSSSDLQDLQFQSSGVPRYQYSSVYGERYEGVEGESAQRCKARLERHRRTAERAAKALAEKNMRDLLAQREQAERNRLAETLDADVRRWSSGKEGNLRALLSTLQYILGPDCGWQPIPLTEVITSAAVKKAYRKATLWVHPDKLQQRGASIQQKYICEKVFDLLKEAWNKFNSEER